MNSESFLPFSLALMIFLTANRKVEKLNVSKVASDFMFRLAHHSNELSIYLFTIVAPIGIEEALAETKLRY